MRSSFATKLVLTALSCAAVIGCGSSGTGTMNVHLVDGPDDTYAHVTLQVMQLEIHGPSGWTTLADFTKTPAGVEEVDLLSLRGVDVNGLPIQATLVDGKGLPEGHYDQMRMLLGPGNTVSLTTAPDDPLPLKVPSGMQSGVKFPVSFDVAASTTRDVFIDVDAHRSIFVHEAGNSGKYLLRPVVHAVDRLLTGAISGKLTGSSGGAPLGGVTVMAEAIQDGRPVIVRSTVSGPTGDYVLDLLPAGGSYYAVAQPVVSALPLGPTTVYSPQASPALAIAATAPVQTWNAAFAAVDGSLVGTVHGGIAPVASDDQSDTVAVEAAFAGTPLIVRTVPGAVTSGAESYAVDLLPVFDGGYTLAVERATVDPTSGLTTSAWTANATQALPTGSPVLDLTLNLAGQ